LPWITNWLGKQHRRSTKCQDMQKHSPRTR
jgi:hypothetical protein